MTMGTNELLAMLAGNQGAAAPAVAPVPAQGPGPAPVAPFQAPMPQAQGFGPADPFAGLGAAYSRKVSQTLPLGRHVCRITECKMHNGHKGLFYIVECELVQTNVEGLQLGPGFSLMINPTKPTVFQPWLKGLIRSILKLDFSAASEAKLLAEAEAIARASVSHGILNGKAFGVEQQQHTTVDRQSGQSKTYIRQNWFPVNV